MATTTRGVRLAPRGLSVGPSRTVTPTPSRVVDDLPFWTPNELLSSADYSPSIIMLFGKRGQGKTLAMTMIGLVTKARYQQRGFKGWKLMANYQVQGADICDEKVVDWLARFPKQGCNATVLVDELPSYFPNRRSLRSANIDFSTFIQQMRKRNIEIVFTAQKPHRVDVQVLEQVNWFVEPERILSNRWLRLYWHDWDHEYTPWPENFNGQNRQFPPRRWDADLTRVYGPLSIIYGKYPTNQIIAPMWSIERDEIIEQDSWDDTKRVDVDDTGNVLSLPRNQIEQEINAMFQAKDETAGDINTFLARNPVFDIKKRWDEIKPLLPESAQTYAKCKDLLRQRGYIIPDRSLYAKRQDS